MWKEVKKIQYYIRYTKGRRYIGRPRKTWLTDVEEDLKDLGIRTWRRRVQDRNEWASLARQALVL